MRTENILTLSTSPSTQSARKPRGLASLTLRRRYTYGRERRWRAVKELDNETGLYYYGARYLDPRTGRWLSGDPALGEYVPSAPVSEEARKRNGSLPGMGGVFNYANLHVYHYAGNSPVKYTDPDGRDYNDDGTYTVEDGDTLWGIYGADWQEKSGYTGDPTKLQVGEVVGQKKVESKTNTTHVTASGSGVGVFVAGIPLSDKQLDYPVWYFRSFSRGTIFYSR
jgi:RHS repeat-associated protein